ncbi:MAG: phospholipid/cholesterol/gamma-HCH transport system permease protein [Pseudomonadota bacterium]|nr:phospholipid/cholesterol/gamma-HCH transport system permease protein [Pseudomonadota bacterium]
MNKMIYIIATIGKPFADLILYAGGMLNLLIEIIFSLPYSILRLNLILKEIYFSGVKSIVIIAVSGWFVGMVLGLQGYNTLERFGSVTMLGSVAALSLLRELGPVLTAILFASRAGSGMTAEIGLMKATEQIEAMSVMAVSPIKRIVAPKFIGGIIAVPLLAALFNTAGIIGSYFVGVTLLRLDQGSFWSQMQDSVDLHYDVINGVIKSAVFGAVVTLIAVYQGFVAKPTAEGVSNATTKTVVSSALTVLALDFILTALMF